MMAAWPGLAWIDLEPGGVVSDLVPRAGHERLVGANVLTDPAQRASALEAGRISAPVVSPPIILDRGEAGLVVRAPVILRGRDGRDFCAGYVAAALRLREAQAGMKLDELATRGYDYALYLGNSFQPGQTVTIAGHGHLSFPGAEVQSAPVPNARFYTVYLAVQPRGGWVNKTKIGLQCLAALVGSGLIWLVLHLLETGREMERSLAETNRRLARVTAERKQGQEALAGAQDELKRARAALQQAESVAGDARARTEAAARAANETRETLQTKLKEAEADAQGLEARLEVAARSLKAKQEELEEAQAGLQAAQSASHELQTRVEAALEASRGAARISDATMARAGELEERNRSLEARLQEAEAARQARVKELDTAVTGLQARLDAASASAREAAEEMALAVARLDQLEDRNRKLKARLLELEGGEARPVESSGVVEPGRAALAPQAATQPPLEAGPAPTPEATTGPVGEPAPKVPASSVPPPAAPLPAITVASEAPPSARRDPATADPADPLPNGRFPSAQRPHPRSVWRRRRPRRQIRPARV